MKKLTLIAAALALSTTFISPVAVAEQKFVTIGTGLLMLGPWVELVFAAIVGWTAVMMLKSGDDEEEIEDYSQHLAYRMVKRFFPLWPKLRGHAFLLTQHEVDAELAKPENADVTVGRDGKAARYATP